MNHFEAWGEGWYYLPAIMMLIMFIAMSFCIFIIYRRRNSLSYRKWFSRYWNHRWITDCCTTAANESPEDILNKRYACGEISKEEFDEMKKNLRDYSKDK